MNSLSLKFISNGYILFVNWDCGGFALIRDLYSKDLVALAKLAEKIVASNWRGQSPETVDKELGDFCKEVGVTL